MLQSNRIDNKVLAQSALTMMDAIGKPLTKGPNKGRAMLYEFANGESVRLRTCNDHVLIVVADEPTPNASLNIEGTDWLLIAMPEIERTPGNVIAYLVPTAEAVREARATHADWLKTNPRTKGTNRTWNLWFHLDAPGKANNYAERWKKYRVKSEAIVTEPLHVTRSIEPIDVKTEVESARQRIAKAANIPVASVKISIDF